MMIHMLTTCSIHCAETGPTLRGAVTKYCEHLLQEVAKSGLVKEVERFKFAIETVITWAARLEADVQNILARAKLPKDHIEEVATELGKRFQGVLEELQVIFPPPETAPGHSIRMGIVDHALTRAGEVLVALVMTFGASEEYIAGLRATFENLKPFVRDVVVTIGESQDV